MNNKTTFVSSATLVLTLSLLGTLAQPCTAAVASFQNGAGDPFGGGAYLGTQDTGIAINGEDPAASQNFGACSYFEIGEDIHSSARGHALIRFNVTSLAGQFTAISNVTLRLFVTQSSLMGIGDTLQAFRLTSANSNWIEGTECSYGAGAPPDNGMTTWAQRIQGSASWAGSAGAGTPSVDYLSAPIATFRYDQLNVSVGTYIDLIFTNTAFLSEWLAGNNTGLLLRAARESDSLLTFASSESATVEWRPQLIVRYTSARPEGGLSIYVADVDVCWFARTNVTYQLQYNTNCVITGPWIDLGAPTLGDGTTNCVRDIVRGQPRRFYCTVELP